LCACRPLASNSLMPGNLHVGRRLRSRPARTLSTVATKRSRFNVRLYEPRVPARRCASRCPRSHLLMEAGPRSRR
jgi:hypothetical protein